MIVVVSGRIKLSLFTPQGRELMLRQHEAGALFGEMALLDGQPRSADATAVTAAEGYVIGKKDFLALITQRPKTAEAVIRFLCAQLRDTTDRWKPSRSMISTPASPASSWRRSARSTVARCRKAPISG